MLNDLKNSSCENDKIVNGMRLSLTIIINRYNFAMFEPKNRLERDTVERSLGNAGIFLLRTLLR